MWHAVSYSIQLEMVKRSGMNSKRTDNCPIIWRKIIWNVSQINTSKVESRHKCSTYPSIHIAKDVAVAICGQVTVDAQSDASDIEFALVWDMPRIHFHKKVKQYSRYLFLIKNKPLIHTFLQGGGVKCNLLSRNFDDPRIEVFRIFFDQKNYFWAWMLQKKVIKFCDDGDFWPKKMVFFFCSCRRTSSISARKNVYSNLLPHCLIVSSIQTDIIQNTLVLRAMLDHASVIMRKIYCLNLNIPIYMCA